MEPGWYDDPTAPGTAWRYHDGTNWTKNAHPDPEGHLIGALWEETNEEEESTRSWPLYLIGALLMGLLVAGGVSNLRSSESPAAAPSRSSTSPSPSPGGEPGAQVAPGGKKPSAPDILSVEERSVKGYRVVVKGVQDFDALEEEIGETPEYLLGFSSSSAEYTGTQETIVDARPSGLATEADAEATKKALSRVGKLEEREYEGTTFSLSVAEGSPIATEGIEISDRIDTAVGCSMDTTGFNEEYTYTCERALNDEEIKKAREVLGREGGVTPGEIRVVRYR